MIFMLIGIFIFCMKLGIGSIETGYLPAGSVGQM